MIISFAWTTDAFIARRKTRTRRYWTDEYAKRFKVGSIHQGYDRSPRFKGKFIGNIKVLGLRKEPTSLMNEFDYEAEGLKYKEEQGLLMRGVKPRDFFEQWKQDGTCPYVLDFEREGDSTMRGDNGYTRSS